MIWATGIGGAVLVAAGAALQWSRDGGFDDWFVGLASKACLLAGAACLVATAVMW